MDRRKLLAVTSTGVVTVIGGCIDQLETIRTGEDFANEVEATQAEYESDAEQCEFDERSLGDDCYDQIVLRDGICSDDPTPLARTEASNDFERPSIRLYGFVFNSEEAVETLGNEGRDEEVADEGEQIRDGSQFVDGIDFETESLLVIQAFFPSVTSLSVDFVGVLNSEKTYVGVSSDMSYGEEVVRESKLLRVAQSSLPDTIIAGQTHTFVGEDHSSHVNYTNGG